MEYRRAEETELEILWDWNIAENPDDARWIRWKKEFIENNRLGRAITFLVLCDDDIPGEGTILLSPECNAVAGRKTLCNGKNIANINALRIQKEYEGQGHISKLMKEIERYAVHNGISKLTIGVEAKETRNLAIYLHWGFTEFLFSEVEDGELILYFGKQLGATELAVSTDFNGESMRMEDIEQTLKQISEAGFTHIHWCHEWDGDYIYSRYEMEQIREWMDKYNLKAKSFHAAKGTRREVLSYDGHFRKDYTSDWEYNRKAGVELIKNRIDLAECLGASDVVLHLYVPSSAIENGDIVKDNFYRQVEKSMDELQPYCMEKGMRICMESLFDMPEEYMLEQWDWIMEKYPKEFLGFCLDSGHVNMVWHEKMTEIIRKYGDRIFAVHLHDNDGIHDSHLLPGEGNINWKETMRALAESAYELPLILEVCRNQDDIDKFLRDAYEKGVWLEKLYYND